MEPLSVCPQNAGCLLSGQSAGDKFASNVLLLAVFLSWQDVFFWPRSYRFMCSEANEVRNWVFVTNRFVRALGHWHAQPAHYPPPRWPQAVGLAEVVASSAAFGAGAAFASLGASLADAHTGSIAPRSAGLKRSGRYLLRDKDLSPCILYIAVNRTAYVVSGVDNSL
jgi:hypothetical protein